MRRQPHELAVAAEPGHAQYEGGGHNSALQASTHDVLLRWLTPVSIPEH
jgi:hypothetical protein